MIKGWVWKTCWRAMNPQLSPPFLSRCVCNRMILGHYIFSTWLFDLLTDRWRCWTTVQLQTCLQGKSNSMSFMHYSDTIYVYESLPQPSVWTFNIPAICPGQTYINAVKSLSTDHLPLLVCRDMWIYKNTNSLPEVSVRLGYARKLHTTIGPPGASTEIKSSL